MALINVVIGNVMGIFLSPALVMLYLGRSGSVSYVRVLSYLTETVIAPLLVGQAIHYVFPKFVAWLQLRVAFNKVSNIMIILFVSGWRYDGMVWWYGDMM